MFWLLSLVGAFLVGALLVYLLGTVFGRGEALPPVAAGEAKKQHWRDLESKPLTAEGIRDAGFSLEIRGYNQAEVDFYIDRLAGRIEKLEQQVGAQHTDQDEATVDNPAEPREQER